MKENTYDNEAFFEAYRHFPRSEKGLAAAGEWPALKRLLPDFSGKRVLDIGCGFGWHCRYAAENGAAYVLGTDISEKMLAVAKEQTAAENVAYRLVAMEDLDFPAESFDVVISSLALHYTPDYRQLCEQAAKFLTPGGQFIFSVEHPIFTAQGSQDWVYDEIGQPAFWPMDNYFYEGQRETTFLGEQVVKYHRTLTTYLTNLQQAGFMLKEVVEPMPGEEFLPEMKDELRRPMMLIIAGEKG